MLQPVVKQLVEETMFHIFYCVVVIVL